MAKLRACYCQLFLESCEILKLVLTPSVTPFLVLCIPLVLDGAPSQIAKEVGCSDIMFTSAGPIFGPIPISLTPLQLKNNIHLISLSLSPTPLNCSKSYFTFFYSLAYRNNTSVVLYISLAL